MTHQVRLEKSKHRGWQATTDIPLEAPRVLRLNTSKREQHGRAAGVSTYASVHKVDGPFITMDLFGDFSKTVALDASARSTEKTVTLVHAQALGQLDAILAEVKAYYAAKDAKEAQRAHAA
jgi:hypothetical protein